MTIREFVGLCADRNLEVIITEGIRKQVAKGSAMEVFTSDREELLNRRVVSFFCNNNKLYIGTEVE